MTPNILFDVFNMVGVIAWAITKMLLVQHKGFDLSGCILVSMANAIGSGRLRDLVLDRHPLFWILT